MLPTAVYRGCKRAPVSNNCSGFVDSQQQFFPGTRLYYLKSETLIDSAASDLIHLMLQRTGPENQTLSMRAWRDRLRHNQRRLYSMYSTASFSFSALPKGLSSRILFAVYLMVHSRQKWSAFEGSHVMLAVPVDLFGRCSHAEKAIARAS